MYIQVSKNIFLDYASFRIYRFVHIFAGNLELIACYTVGLELFFYPQGLPWLTSRPVSQINFTNLYHFSAWTVTYNMYME